MGIALSSLQQKREQDAKISLPLHEQPQRKAGTKDVSISAAPVSNGQGETSFAPPRPGYVRIMAMPPHYYRILSRVLCVLIGVPAALFVLFWVYLMIAFSTWRF
ncbi:Hypothetical protein D9617_9g025360 [Elsinoe fawcettii]|nr:Hypothetical protein D9617_9g025360 [Elsinoe fawcettii]